MQPQQLNQQQQLGLAQPLYTTQPGVLFSSNVSILTGIGWGGNAGMIQWGSDNRIRLYESVAGGPWMLVFDINPYEIKKYDQLYGIITLTLTNTVLNRRKFKLVFSREAYEMGMVGQTVSGGVVSDLLRAKGSSRGKTLEDASGLTWWVDTLNRFGVKAAAGARWLTTNQANRRWNIGFAIAGAALMGFIILFMIVSTILQALK